jgi:protein TonB
VTQPVDVIPTAAPIEAPKEIKPEPPAPPTLATQGVVGGVPGGVPGGQPGGVVNLGVPPPPPPPPPKAEPVRVGGAVKEPQRIKFVEPKYPQIAINAKIAGQVYIEATIATDGSVKNARILRSVNPLLNDAALDAVRQWRYSPTTLNGVPVEVLMTVNVNFQLR